MLKRFIKSPITRVLKNNSIAYRCYEKYSFYHHQSMIQSASKKGNLRLHLGCGANLIDDWVNVDMKLNPAIVTAKLPRGLKHFQDTSVQFIYASHILEHMEYPREAVQFVRECHRILVPGRALRIVVPGIQKIIEAYVRNDKSFFKVQNNLHPACCTTKLEHLIYALQQDGEHKYGYDFETIGKLLLKGGFTNFAQSDYNTSEFSELRVDYRDNKDNHGNYLSLYVDAIK